MAKQQQFLVTQNNNVMNLENETIVNSLEQAQAWLDEYCLDHTLINEIKEGDTVIGFEIVGDQPMTGEKILIRS